MTEATPFLQKYDITFLRPPTIPGGLLVLMLSRIDGKVRQCLENIAYTLIIELTQHKTPTAAPNILTILYPACKYRFKTRATSGNSSTFWVIPCPRIYSTLQSLILRFLTSRSTGSAGPQRPCHGGLRPGPSRGRCHGWRPGCTSWPAWPARTYRR